MLCENYETSCLHAAFLSVTFNETAKTFHSFLAQISFQFLTKARIHVQIANGNETIFSVTTVPNKVTYFSWSHVAFSIDIVTKKV